jgi:tetratricopeptide (TPR) repeat protein
MFFGKTKNAIHSRRRESPLKAARNVCFRSAAAIVVALAAPALADSAPEREALRAYVDAHPTDYEASFAYVRASIAARDEEAAIATLERLLFYNASLTRAKFELGNLYSRLASNAMAVRYYEAALADEALDPEARRRLESYLAAARKELAPDRVYGLLQAGVRYNSNPASLPSASVISSLGLLVPGGKTYPASAAAFAMADLRYVHDFQNERGDTFEARALGYATGQFRFGELNVALVDVVAGPRLALSTEFARGVTIYPYAAFGSATLGGSLYATSAGGGVSIRIPLSRWFSLEPGAEWRHVDLRDPNFLTSSALLNAGSLATGSIAAHWTPAEKISIDARVFATTKGASTAALSSTQTGAEASIKVDYDPPFAGMPLLWSATPFARFRNITFDAANAALLSPVARQDTQWRFGTQFDMPVSALVGFTALVDYTKNDSNIAQFQSSGWSVALGTTVRF